jgi:methionine synthase I (cobalamin-dependent)
MADFLKALRSGRILLMDGAMGTELVRAGVPLGDCFDALNVTQPELVGRIHREYVDAGARVLLTNTFQLFSHPVAQNLDESELTSIGMAAVRLARSAAEQDRHVLLDVGPQAPPQFPGPTVQRDKARDCSLTLASAKIVDGVLFETGTSIDATGTFLTATSRNRLRERDVPMLLSLREQNTPLLVSWTFRRDTDGKLVTHAGHYPMVCALDTARNLEAAALGVNCGTGIGLPELLEIITEYRSVTDLPLFVRPNAGTPKQMNRQWVYPETPQSMADWLPQLFEAGVVMVGGCCGTTPAHIAAFRKVVDDWNACHTM